MINFARTMGLAKGVQAEILPGTPMSNPDMNGPEGPAVGVPPEELPQVEPGAIIDIPL